MQPVLRSIVMPLAASALGICLCGCSSVSGRQLLIDPNTGHVTDTKDVHGLPVLLKRPTKAVFIATTTTYDVAVPVKQADASTKLEHHKEKETNISDQPILLGPTDVYSIDPKRPFFGTLQYGVTLSDGMVTGLTGKIDDKTLGEFHAIVKDVIDKFVPSVTKQAGELSSTAIRTFDSQAVTLVIFDLTTGMVTRETIP